MQRYRLGLDVGTNSLGWAVVELNDDNDIVGVIDMGSRIFSDGRKPKDKQSLAVDRRIARQARRRRDRFIRRRQRLMRQLVEFNLFPSSELDRKALEEIDPWEIRARALDEKVSLPELARAIFHLNQRRGFKSGRIQEADGDNEGGMVKDAIKRTADEMMNAKVRTLGEYLYYRKEDNLSVRARPSSDGSSYSLYVDRSMIEKEFDLLWASQQRFHGSVELSQAAFEALKDTILYQRPLKPVDPGWCSYEEGEPRAPLALPMSQQFRMLQELNHLRIVRNDRSERAVTLEERNHLLGLLERQSDMSMAKIRKELGCEKEDKLNMELGGRKKVKGNGTSVKLSAQDCFGEAWFDFKFEKQNEIVEKIVGSRTNEELIDYLESVIKLDRHRARAISEVLLDDGYGQLSRKAILKINEHLKEEVVTYDKAVVAAGYSHSSQGLGGKMARLPYYGEVLPKVVSGAEPAEEVNEEIHFGKIANPTVHIALNQIRKVVNTLIDRYGRPTEITVEVTRDLKQSLERKKQIQAGQKENQNKNDGYRETLKDLGLPNNYGNRLRLKLWEELNPDDVLDRRCPYSGAPISASMLFSAQVEVDHIVPFSKSLDDSVGNKVVCLARTNQDKGNRTPFEAFGNSPGEYSWVEIKRRASLMPRSKARFKFSEDQETTPDAWLARQLTDTAYISKVAREYLTAVCSPNHVWAIPGRLTAMLRHSWGLNSILGDTLQKERNDHRHHSLDAVVVACTARGTLQRISRASSKGFAEKVSKYVEPPFEGFREAVANRISKVVVSHKPDHGVEAALHNKTAYGLITEPNDKGVSLVAYRKKLSDLSKNSLDKVADSKIREGLIAAVQDKTATKAVTEAILAYGASHGIRRVRLHERIAVIGITEQKTGFSSVDSTDETETRAYKGYKPDGNYCVEIVETKDGKWSDEIIRNFDANQPEFRKFRLDVKRYRKTSFSGKPLVMRLCKGDTVAMDEDDVRCVYQVIKFSRGRVVLSPVHEANCDARHRDSKDAFKLKTLAASRLRKLGARRVFVDPIGKVRDSNAATNY